MMGTASRPGGWIIRSVESLRETVRDIVSRTNLNLAQIAALAFVIGVVFHVCVVYAVLDGGSSPEAASQPARIATAASTARAATPTPNPTADRTSCAEIRNTDYRSPTEREWFLRNCS